MCVRTGGILASSSAALSAIAPRQTTLDKREVERAIPKTKDREGRRRRRRPPERGGGDKKRSIHVDRRRRERKEEEERASKDERRRRNEHIFPPPLSDLTPTQFCGQREGGGEEHPFSSFSFSIRPFPRFLFHPAASTSRETERSKKRRRRSSSQMHFSSALAQKKGAELNCGALLPASQTPLSLPPS